MLRQCEHFVCMLRVIKCIAGESLRLESTSGDHPIQPPCSSRVSQSWVPRTKDRDSTTSLGSLVKHLQCKKKVGVNVQLEFAVLRI